METISNEEERRISFVSGTFIERFEMFTINKYFISLRLEKSGLLNFFNYIDIKSVLIKK